MRKRIYNWLGERFVYLWLEGERGQSTEQQSQALFDRAGALLASATGVVGPDNLARRWESLPVPVRRYLRFAIAPDAAAIRQGGALRPSCGRRTPNEPAVRAGCA